MLWVGGKTTAKRKREESHEDGRSVDGTAGFLPQRLPYDVECPGSACCVSVGALQRERGWALFSPDTLRKRLAQLNPSQPQADAFGQGIYTREWTARTYDALVKEAGRALADGRSVVLDATFLRRADRQAAARQAAAFGSGTIFVECVCPRAIALERLAQRWQSRLAKAQEGASRASDARPDLYDAQAAAWEDFVPGEEQDGEHVVITTTQPLAASNTCRGTHGIGSLRRGGKTRGGESQTWHASVKQETLPVTRGVPRL